VALSVGIDVCYCTDEELWLWLEEFGIMAR